MATDDERRLIEGRLRELAGRKVPCDIDCYLAEAVMGHDFCETPCDGCLSMVLDRLADLIEPDTTSDTTSLIADTTKCDPTEHGIDSIYEWCFSGIEGADEDEDELFCAIMQAIEDYRHPERVTARTARAVDREGLLALADELTESYVESWSDGDELVMSRGAVALVVRRIREACGVVA